MAEKSESKPKKKHLHRVITEAVVDHKGKTTGYTTHHQYKAHHADHHAEPEKPAAVHDNAEEAGEHVTDQFAAQEGAQAQGGAPGGGGEAPDMEGGAAGGGEAEPGEPA